jgi:hypothetical protein
VVPDELLLRQLTDPNADRALRDFAPHDLHEYYLTLERRIVGANVALYEVNKHRSWIHTLGESDIERAFDSLASRWHEVTRALPFEDAHALATEARGRREEIREGAREKLKAYASTDSTGESEASSESTEVRDADAAADPSGALSEAEA